MRTSIGITTARSFAAISGTLWLEMSISLTGRSVGRKQLRESHIGRISRRSGNRYTSKRGNGLETRRPRRNIGDMRMVCGNKIIAHRKWLQDLIETYSGPRSASNSNLE